MKITEIFDRILLKSGQFVLRKGNVEIDVDAFRLLVEEALAIYSRAVPFVKRYDKEIIYPRQFTFTDNFDAELGRVPDWLSEVTPVRYSSSGYNFALFGNNQMIQEDQTVDPLEAPWDYDTFTNTLTVPYSAKYKITACYKHKIEALDEYTDKGVQLYDVKTITYEDTIFFKLLQGLFLQGIGRSRRSFTMNDLPIIMDADEMANEGKELETEAKEELQNVQKFYLAMG